MGFQAFKIVMIAMLCFVLPVAQAQNKAQQDIIANASERPTSAVMLSNPKALENIPGQHAQPSADIVDGLPKLLSALLTTYPDAIFGFLGRDTALLANAVEAVFYANGDKNRVRYINISTPIMQQLTGERLADYLVSLGLSDKKGKQRPFIMIDYTSLGISSQSTLITRAVVARLRKNGFTSREMIDRFNVLSLQSREKFWSPFGLTPEQIEIQKQKQAEQINHSREYTLGMSLGSDFRTMAYSPAWHDTFSNYKIVKKGSSDKIVPVPLSTFKPEIRTHVYGQIAATVKAVTWPKYLAQLNSELHFATEVHKLLSLFDSVETGAEKQKQIKTIKASSGMALEAILLRIFEGPHVSEMADLIELSLLKASQSSLQYLAENYFPTVQDRHQLDLLKIVIERGNSKTLQVVAEHCFKMLANSDRQDLNIQLIERQDQATIRYLAEDVFGNVYSGSYVEKAGKYLKMMVKIADQESLQILAYKALSQDQGDNVDAAVKLFIEKADAKSLAALVEHTLTEPVLDNPKPLLKMVVEKAIANGDSTTMQKLAELAFPAEHNKDMKSLLKLVIENADQKTLELLAEHTFSERHMEDKPELFALMIDKADQSVLQIMFEHAFPINDSKQNYRFLKMIAQKADSKTAMNLAEAIGAQNYNIELKDVPIILLGKLDADSYRPFAESLITGYYKSEMNDLVKTVIKTGDVQALEYMAAWLNWQKDSLDKDAHFKLLAEKMPVSHLQAVAEALSPRSNKMLDSKKNEIFQILIERANSTDLPKLAEVLLYSDFLSADLLKSMIEKADPVTLQYLAKTHWSDISMPEHDILQDSLRFKTIKARKNFLQTELAAAKSPLAKKYPSCRKLYR